MGWQQDIYGSWVCEVWQSAYGHLVDKRTWLYYVGDKPPIDINIEQVRAPYQISRDDSRDTNRPQLQGIKTKETPIAFRDMLIELVSNAKNN